MISNNLSDQRLARIGFINGFKEFIGSEGKVVMDGGGNVEGMYEGLKRESGNVRRSMYSIICQINIYIYPEHRLAKIYVKNVSYHNTVVVPFYVIIINTNK